MSLDPFNETTTSNKYQIGWLQYLASKKELIYAQIVFKNRETSNSFKEKIVDQSNGFRSTLKQFPIESRSLSSSCKDQIKVIRYLIDNFKNVDSKRVIVFGTDISAYTALNVLAEDHSNLLKGAIVIAPVVNWRLMG